MNVRGRSYNSDELAIDLVSLRKVLPYQAMLGKKWLARPYPRDCKRRVLLIYINNELAWPQFLPFLRYRERFHRAGIVFRAIAFDDIDRYELPTDIAAIFIQAPYDPKAGQIEDKLKALRTAYPAAPISFFDWFAPTDIRFGDIVEPYVSAYLKKARLRDTNSYLLPTKGHTQLVDYFASRHGLPIDPPYWQINPLVAKKVIAGPSFFSSRMLMAAFERRNVLRGSGRPIDIHARIATNGAPWYAAMRQEAKKAILASLGDLNIVVKGKVSRAKFMAELSQSKLCFSPFGYGELCWRDFEAILSGAVLVKQDMGHIITAPDLFKDRETYFAVRWDLADLEQTVREALADPVRLMKMAETARSIITEYLAGPALEHLVETLIAAPIDLSGASDNPGG